MAFKKHSVLWLIFLLVLGTSCTEFGQVGADVVQDGFGPSSCVSDEDCADFGPECSKRRFCGNSKFCDYELKEDYCMIGTECVTAYAASKDEPCMICIPEQTQIGFSILNCGAGKFCVPESGECAELPDQGNGDVFPDTTPDCPALGCCSQDSDCPVLPGECSLTICGQSVEGFCSESTVTGECNRGLNKGSRCGQTVKVNLSTHEQNASLWSDVPQGQVGEAKVWTFEDTHVLFEQTESAGGQTSGIFGPKFSMYKEYCQPANLAEPIPLVVQVEHSGTLISAIPEVKVRLHDEIEWISIGKLSSHSQSIPDFFEHIIPDDIVQGANSPFAFQVALESQLSPIPQDGEKKIYSVRVASGNPPLWQVDQSAPFKININKPPNLFIYADDLDLDNQQLDYGDLLRYSDVTTLLTSSVTKPYQQDDCILVGVSEDSWELNCSISGEISVDADEQIANVPGEEAIGRQGFLLKFKQNQSQSDFTSIIDVLDREGSGGLRDRLVLSLQLRELPVCGDGVIGDDEECDVGENTSPFCNTDCTAPDFTAVLLSVDQTQGIDAAAIPASNGFSFLWHDPVNQALWLRSIDAGPSSQQGPYLSEPVLVSASFPSGEHTHGRLDALNASRIAVAWTHNDSSENNVRLSLYTPSGDTVETDLLPYPAPGSSSIIPGQHSMPDVSVMDGTKGALVWVNEWVEDGQIVTNSRLLLNILNLSDNTFDSTPIVVTTDLGLEVSNPRVIRMNEDPTAISKLFIVWQEKILADESTRIRFAIYDSATGGLSVEATTIDLGGPNGLRNPSITRTDGGKVAVVWERTDETGVNGIDVAFRLYGSNGSALGEGILLGTELSGNQLRPSVVSSDGGDLLALWQNDNETPGDFDIYGRAGSSLANTFVWVQEAGPEVSLNEYTAGNQTRPVAAPGNIPGTFAVFWISHDDVSETTQVRLRVLKASSIQP